MYIETISMEMLDSILEPINAPAISGQSSVHVQTNDFQLNLKDPDDVTIEDLTALIANARAVADEAEVDEVPEEIDISDAVARAIANALNGDEALWLNPAEDPEP